MRQEFSVDSDVVIVKPTAVEAITRGEIDRQIAAARENPRDIKTFRAQVAAMALVDDETAAMCYYALPRAGKQIIGPSVRFAEIVAYCYTNMRTHAFTIDEGEKFVTAQAWALDLERNVGHSVTTRRRIVDRSKKRYDIDMIGVTSNAAESIAFRNAVFRTVPAPVWKPSFEAALHFATGDEESLKRRVQAMLAFFGTEGASTSEVLRLVGRAGVDEIELADLTILRGVATAIRFEGADPQRIFSGRTEPEKPFVVEVEPAKDMSEHHQQIDELFGEEDEK